MSETAEPTLQTLRNHVLARDEYTCQICFDHAVSDDADLEVHHIVPRNQGGEDEMDNLITTCAGCHQIIHIDGYDPKPKRDSNGSFAKKVPDEAFLARVSGEMSTTGEIADDFPLTRQAVLIRLKQLEEEGHINSRMVGNANVWTEAD